MFNETNDALLQAAYAILLQNLSKTYCCCLQSNNAGRSGEEGAVAEGEGRGRAVLGAAQEAPGWFSNFSAFSVLTLY